MKRKRSEQEGIFRYRCKLRENILKIPRILIEISFINCSIYAQLVNVYTIEAG